MTRPRELEPREKAEIHAIRKRIVAWSRHAQQIEEARREAADQRRRAMFDAARAGVPWQTITADAGLANMGNAHRMVAAWCKENHKRFPRRIRRKGEWQ